MDSNTLVQLVRRWGDASSAGIFLPQCQIFSDESKEGLIGYRLEAGHAVVLGDPVCAQADKPSLANLFHQFCRQNELGVVYIIASEEFANWSANNLSSALIEFGEKLILDPQRDYMKESGHMARLLGRMLIMAAKHGVIIPEYTLANPELENSFQEFATAWQKNRKGLQVYLNDLSVFGDRIGRRSFYAQHKGNIAGLPITPPRLKVLRRPVESALLTTIAKASSANLATVLPYSS